MIKGNVKDNITPKARKLRGNKDIPQNNDLEDQNEVPATVANVNKEAKTTENDNNKCKNSSKKITKVAQRDSRKVVIADENNNATVPINRHPRSRSANSANSKRSKISEDTEIATPKGINLAEKASSASKDNPEGELIGIQTGGVLREFRVGPSIHDEILLDVDMHEFDEDGMVDSDESSSDEAPNTLRQGKNPFAAIHQQHKCSNGRASDEKTI